MKKVIKKGLVLVVMFATMVSNANEFTYLTKERDSKVTNFTINNLVEGSMLLIKDSNGLILYKELIEQSGDYSKGFDLTSLPDGEYYFEVDKDVDVRIIPFEVIANKVEFKKDEEYKIFKPVVYVKGKNVYVTRMSLIKNPIEIKVYDEDDNMVFSEKIEEATSLGKIYDFSKVKKRNFTVVFKSEGRFFKNSIKI